MASIKKEALASALPSPRSCSRSLAIHRALLAKAQGAPSLSRPTSTAMASSRKQCVCVLVFAVPLILVPYTGVLGQPGTLSQPPLPVPPVPVPVGIGAEVSPGSGGETSVTGTPPTTGTPPNGTTGTPPTTATPPTTTVSSPPPSAAAELPADAKADVIPADEYDTFVRFYQHIIMTGDNAARFITVPGVAANDFGQTITFHAKIAYSDDHDAPEVGRSGGTITFTDITSPAGQNVYTANFYDTSSITGMASVIFLGHEKYTDEVETAQYAVVAGTGKYRCAKGIVLEDTVFNNGSFLIVKNDMYMNTGCGRSGY